MPTENVTTKFKVDISDLKKNIQTANNQIKLLTAEMKNANAGMEKGAETADSLTSKIQKQSQIVQQEENKLQALKDQLARLNQNQEQGERIIADLTAKHQEAVRVYGESSDEAAAYAAELGRAQAAQERNRTAAEKLTIQIVNQDTAVKNAQSQVKTFENALDNLDEEVVDVGNDTKETTTAGIGAFGVALGNLASQAITLVIDKLSDMAKAVKDAYLEFDKGRDAVVKATGATGKAADNLTKSYANVSKTVGGSFEDIGEALGEVNTRFGFTDDQLEETTQQFVKFADITGTDAKNAVRLVSRAMGDAGIKSEDYNSVLDALAVAAQASGISIDKLTEYMTKYGAPMRALGFDTNESIAIFSQWEQAGVNTEIAFSGMKNAISSWSKEGKNAKDEFKKTLEQIAAAPDIADATTQAIEVFGKKAGPDLADAIQNGRFEYSRFLELIENSEGTVDATYDETQTAVDKTALALQNIKTTAAALVNDYVEKYSPQIEAAINAVTQKIEEVVPKIENAAKWIVENLPGIEAGVTAIGAAFAAWKVVGIITAVTTALKGMSAAEILLAAKQAILNAVMLANPIGLVIAAIVGLVAAFVVLWNKSEKFRKFWTDLWEVIKSAAGLAWAAISRFFVEAWEKVKEIWGGISEFFSNLWESIKSVFFTIATWIDENVFQPIMEFFQPVIDFFTAAWNIIKELAAGCWEAIKIIWGIVSSWVDEHVIQPVKKFFTDLWEVIKTAAILTWDRIKYVWSVVSGWFNEKIITPVKNFFTGMWNGLKDGASKAWAGIKNVFAPVADWFKEKFSNAWQKVKDVFSTGGKVFSGIKEGITNAFKKVVNMLIRGINKIVAFPFEKINGMLDKIQNIEIAGTRPFENLVSRLPVPQIPELELAKGGIVKKATPAVIGEDGAEAVIPLEKNKGGLKQIAGLIANEINGGGAFRGAFRGAGGTVNNYNFNQTNNSPKTLSRWDIYRDTKNLINAIQGV